MTTPADALATLAGLVLEDGATWGEVARDFQLHDARALLDPPPGGPRRVFTCRPRGASKTSDAGGLALSLLVTLAPRASRSYLYAADKDQAAEILDAFRGFVERTPGLTGAVTISESTVTVRASGATLTVESSDAASAWSKKPWLVVIDELSSWPASPNHRRLWAAIVSALPKRKDSRLLVATMAGSPTHWSHKVFEAAGADPGWVRTHVPGPCPWWSPADVEQARRDLDIVTEGEFAQVIMCEWVAPEQEQLARAEDVLAAVRVDPVTLEPVPGRRYVVTLDVGTRRDYSAVAVSHTEERDGRRLAVVDHTRHWKPTRTRHVDLDGDVEPAVEALCRRYNNAVLRFDRSQAEQMTQRLARRGVRVSEFVFSTPSTNKLAKALAIALRDRQVEVPDDAELTSELQTAKLVDTGPGTVKMINPAGTHDDLATVVGMALVHLGARPEPVPVDTRAVQTFAASNLVPSAAGGAPAPAGTGTRRVSPAGLAAASRDRSPYGRSGAASPFRPRNRPGTISYGGIEVTKPWYQPPADPVPEEPEPAAEPP